MVRLRWVVTVKRRLFCPLSGKILNVEQARMDRILANNEVKNLIIALGIGIGEVLGY